MDDDYVYFSDPPASPEPDEEPDAWSDVSSDLSDYIQYEEYDDLHFLDPPSSPPGEDPFAAAWPDEPSDSGYESDVSDDQQA